MSTNLSGFDVNLPMDSNDIEHLVNTFLFYLKSSKEAQRVSRQNTEEKLRGMSDEIKKMFVENENSVKSLSKDLCDVTVSVKTAFDTVVDSIKEQNSITIKRLSLLEEKMSMFEVLVGSMNEKLSLIVDRLPSDNLKLKGSKAIIKDNTNFSENSHSVGKEPVIVDATGTNGVSKSGEKNSDNSGGAVNYSLSDSESCDEYLPFNSETSPYVKIQNGGSENEDYYDIPDRIEREYTDNLAPVEDIERGVIYSDGVKLSTPDEENDCSQSCKSTSISSSSSVDENASIIAKNITPVENFCFKLPSDKGDISSILNRNDTEKNLKTDQMEMVDDCSIPTQSKINSVSNEENQQTQMNMQKSDQEQVELDDNNKFKIVYKSENPCMLFHLSPFCPNFNLVGETDWKIIFDVKNKCHKLLFNQDTSDDILFCVILDEDINFKKMEGSNFIMFKYFNDINGLKIVDKHCIEFKNEMEINHFVVSINAIRIYFPQ